MNHYYFRTDIKDYLVPREVMIEAMKLLPKGKSFDEYFSKRTTNVHKHIKQWALKVESNENSNT